jgi:hypothetical protein
MISSILDTESQKKINNVLNEVVFPIKCYCIIIAAILLLISYYLYKIEIKIS